LNGWNPFDEFSNLRAEVNRLFGLSANPAERPQFFNTWAPVIDVYEDKNHLTVKAELPGLARENIAVSLHDGALTISGERKAEQKRAESESYRTERFYGRFQRTVTLPTAVAGDKVSATYTDGILTVTLPKAEEAKPKQIAVSVK
jgi:HSP20 family protein